MNCVCVKLDNLFKNRKLFNSHNLLVTLIFECAFYNNITDESSRLRSCKSKTQLPLTEGS